MSPVYTIHPSRTAPLCTDCHWRKQTDSRFERCDHPATPVNPVDGGLRTCHDTRAATGACGPAGGLFTPRAAQAEENKP